MPIESGLDYAFLKYMDVSVDGEEGLHSFYLPMLVGRQRVLDLGCGMGGFVKLLRQHGIDGYGVDSDPQCIAEARAHELPVIEADVVDYLRTLEPASLDAIFSAHMVEHMPYAVVLETIQLAHRALKPGGRLILATPNPRALVAHLELYHMHFGHISMYHPKLLAFFMTYAGFAHTESGENPQTITPHVTGDSPLRTLPTFVYRPGLAGNMDNLAKVAIPPSIPVEQVLPKPKSALRGLLWRFKIGLVHWLIRPYFDRLVDEVHQTSTQMQTRLADQLQQQGQMLQQLDQQFATTLQAIDRPFECYVIGDKANT